MALAFDTFNILLVARPSHQRRGRFANASPLPMAGTTAKTLSLDWWRRSVAIETLVLLCGDLRKRNYDLGWSDLAIQQPWAASRGLGR